MTLWANEEAMDAFVKSGAHLEAMKTSKEIAKEIRTITIDAEAVPNSANAKELLKNGQVIQYLVKVSFSIFSSLLNTLKTNLQNKS